jgi:hypothetical protein
VESGSGEPPGTGCRVQGTEDWESVQYLKRPVSTREMKELPSWAFVSGVNLKGVTRVGPREAASQSTMPSPTPVASAMTWATRQWFR